MTLTASAEAMRDAAMVLRRFSETYPAPNSGKGGNGWMRAADLLDRNADWLKDWVKAGVYADDCMEAKSGSA